MKKLLLVTLCLLSVNSYADQKARAACTDITVAWEKKEIDLNVFGTMDIGLENQSNDAQNYHMIGRVINLQTGERGQWEKDKTVEAHKGWGITEDIKLLMKITNPGSHPFKVVLDITGPQNFHAESQCQVFAKKYEFGDFANGLKEHVSE